LNLAGRQDSQPVFLSLKSLILLAQNSHFAIQMYSELAQFFKPILGVALRAARAARRRDEQLGYMPARLLAADTPAEHMSGEPYFAARTCDLAQQNREAARRDPQTPATARQSH
jgi:hypothetical protein